MKEFGAHIGKHAHHNVFSILVFRRHISNAFEVKTSGLAGGFDMMEM